MLKMEVRRNIRFIKTNNYRINDEKCNDDTNRRQKKKIGEKEGGNGDESSNKLARQICIDKYINK